jgi:hypothetical protein
VKLLAKINNATLCDSKRIEIATAELLGKNARFY